MITAFLFIAALAAQDTPAAATQEPPPPPAATVEDEEGAPEAPGQETAEPDPQSSPQAYRPVSASAPVSIDAYSRDYEGPQSASEAQYDSTIRDGLLRAESQASPLEGTWQILAADSTPIVQIELRAAGSKRMEGAWIVPNAGPGLDRSGFLSAVMATSRLIEVNYFVGQTRAPVVVLLSKGNDGRWRGSMIAPDGTSSAVSLSAVR